jgi:hypothetical protein
VPLAGHWHTHTLFKKKKKTGHYNSFKGFHIHLRQVIAPPAVPLSWKKPKKRKNGTSTAEKKLSWADT